MEINISYNEKEIAHKVNAISSIKEYYKVSGWANQSYVAYLSEKMLHNKLFAIRVFTIANLICFLFTHFLANKLAKRVDEQILHKSERKFNHFLIHIVIVGTSFLTVNLTLSKLFHYPLSKLTLTAMTMTAIAFRFILRYVV